MLCADFDVWDAATTQGFDLSAVSRFGSDARLN